MNKRRRWKAKRRRRERLLWKDVIPMILKITFDESAVESGRSVTISGRWLK